MKDGTLSLKNECKTYLAILFQQEHNYLEILSLLEHLIADCEIQVKSLNPSSALMMKQGKLLQVKVDRP